MGEKSVDAETPIRPLAYNVLRGKDRIGENLIEITYGETKLLVELGKALDGGDELSDTEKSVLNTAYDAVIVTHYHADHAGLIGRKKDCPIYIGTGAYRMVKATNEYRGETVGDNVTTYQNGRPFPVGGIKITPYLCDHSAFDSYMLLFEAGGNRILYTGDFRFHGRKNQEDLLSRLPKHVNTLICEGTNTGTTKPCISESELETKAVALMKSTEKPIFLWQSASNIDRIVSFYRAAKQCGRIFYEDDYVALLATAAGGKIPRPDVFKDVYAFPPRTLRGKREDTFLAFRQKRGIAKIAETAKFAMLVRPSMLNFLKKLASKTDLTESVLIYSIWSGYQEKPENAKFIEEVKKMGIQIEPLHTSGHASKDGIERLKQTVRADEFITVHTCPNGASPSKNVKTGEEL